jgi:hypothetical protein
VEPEVKFSGDYSDGLANGLNGHVAGLNPEQLAVIREIVADPHPRRRWLSPEDAAAIEALRSTKPQNDAIGKPVRDYPYVRAPRRVKRD